jgi:hypothetical protein
MFGCCNWATVAFGANRFEIPGRALASRGMASDLAVQAELKRAMDDPFRRGDFFQQLIIPKRRAPPASSPAGS